MLVYSSAAFIRVKHRGYSIVMCHIPYTIDNNILFYYILTILAWCDILWIENVELLKDSDDEKRELSS